MKHNSNNYRIYNKIPDQCKQGIIVHYILQKSPLYKIVKDGDILCNISYDKESYDIDDFGEIDVYWTHVKISINNLIKRCGLNETIKIKFFSIKKRTMITKSIKLKTYNDVYPIKKLFLPIDKLDYEITGGMIVMDLSLNHLSLYKFKGLSNLMSGYDIFKPQLVVTYIFKNSKLSQYNSFSPYTVITKVNNLKTNSLKQFRKNIKKTIKKNNNDFILIENHNNESAILKVDELVDDDKKLYENYGYNKSDIQDYFNNLLK